MQTSRLPYSLVVTPRCMVKKSSIHCSSNAASAHQSLSYKQNNFKREKGRHLEWCAAKECGLAAAAAQLLGRPDQGQHGLCIKLVDTPLSTNI